MNSIIDNYVLEVARFVDVLSHIPNSKASCQHGYRAPERFFRDLTSTVGRSLPKLVEEFYVKNNFDFLASWAPPCYAEDLSMVHVELPNPLRRYYDDADVESFRIPMLWDYESLYPDAPISSLIPYFFCIATQGSMRCVGFDLRTESDDPPLYYLDGVGLLEDYLTKISNSFSSFLHEWKSCGPLCQ